MEVVFTPAALAELHHWKQSGNKAVQTKITALLQSICDTPFDGIGKPEALKYELVGKWSRRIDKEHRIVYALCDDTIYVYSLRGHYSK